MRPMIAAVALGLATMFTPAATLLAQDAKSDAVVVKAITPKFTAKTEEEIRALAASWNTAISAFDKPALRELYRAQDRAAVDTMPPKEVVNARIQINKVERINESAARIDYLRVWKEPKAGSLRGSLFAVLVDGKWQLSTAPIDTPIAASPAKPAEVTKAAVPPTKSATAVKPPLKGGAVVGGQPMPTKPHSRPAQTAQSVATPAPQAVATNRVKDIYAEVGRVQIVKLPFAINRVAVGDPVIADFTVVSPREIYILGKTVGTTNMVLWEKSGRSHVINASVSIDLVPLRETLRRTFPGERDISVSAASGSVLVSGSVADTLVADAVLRLADAYIDNLNNYMNRALTVEKLPRTNPSRTEVSNQIIRENDTRSTSFRVVNMLRVRDAQQVMLEVRIAEVSKTLLESLGFNFSSLAKGRVDSALSGNQFDGADVSSISSRIISSNAALGSLSYLISGKRGTVVNIDAQKNDELVKILAEPTIVAMSGKEGSFLSGGKIFLPVPSSANQTPGLVEQEFGVRLRFLPTVLDGGRISLRVDPEVSELVSRDPVLINARKVSSTVQLRDGETLVIGGLMRNNVKEVINAFPVLGELPILGALFRSTEFVNDKTELVIVVSPSLVKGTEAMPMLPTDNFQTPSRPELFIEGRMEGRGVATPRADR